LLDDDRQRTSTMVVGDLSETVAVSAARRGGATIAAVPAQRGGSIRPPHRKNEVYPEYPPHLRAAGVEAVVRLEGVVGPDGTVPWLRALHSNVHPDFVKASMDCVKQWRYEPTRLNGTPIGVYMTVTFNFRLE
jgi:TonB family protein